MSTESVFLGSIAVLMVAGGLLGLATWSKRRRMLPLLKVVDGGRLVTSWLGSTCRLEGEVDGRRISIESAGIARGVLRVTLEHSVGGVRLIALRRTWLRVALGKVAAPGFERISAPGLEVLLRWMSSAEPAERATARRGIEDLMLRHPTMDRLILSGGSMESLHTGLRASDLDPAVIEARLQDLTSFARELS